MRRILIIILLVALQFVYFIAYVKLDGPGSNFKSSPIPDQNAYLFIVIWISIWFANTYLLHNLFPMMKNYIKSKNILFKIIYFIVLLLFTMILTNIPTENILMKLI